MHLKKNQFKTAPPAPEACETTGQFRNICVRELDCCPLPLSNGTEVAWAIANWDREAAAAKHGDAWIGTASDLKTRLIDKPELLCLSSRQITYQLKALARKCPSLVKVLPPRPGSHSGTVYHIMLRAPLPRVSEITDQTKPRQPNPLLRTLLDRLANWAEFEKQVIAAANETGVIDDCGAAAGQV